MRSVRSRTRSAFNTEKVCIENNTFTDASTLNGYIEHYTACQKELYENQIASLKEEITALRGQVANLLAILGEKV